MTPAFLRYALIPVSATLSALAQILLKHTSSRSPWSASWFVWLALSAALYGLSFFAYAYLLRLHPVSRIYPLVTVIVIVVVSAYGFLIGESFGLRHLLGLALGIVAIVLLLA